MNGLTDREKEIAELIIGGLTYQEIAGRLGISIHTVKAHVSNMFTKLNVNSKTQLLKKIYK